MKKQNLPSCAYLIHYSKKDTTRFPNYFANKKIINKNLKINANMFKLKKGMPVSLKSPSIRFHLPIHWFLKNPNLLLPVLVISMSVVPVDLVMSLWSLWLMEVDKLLSFKLNLL